jgi:hypothetical protein
MIICSPNSYYVSIWKRAAFIDPTSLVPSGSQRFSTEVIPMINWLGRLMTTYWLDEVDMT